MRACDHERANEPPCIRLLLVPKLEEVCRTICHGAASKELRRRKRELMVCNAWSCRANWLVKVGARCNPLVVVALDGKGARLGTMDITRSAVP